MLDVIVHLPLKHNKKVIYQRLYFISWAFALSSEDASYSQSLFGSLVHFLNKFVAEAAILATLILKRWDFWSRLRVTLHPFMETETWFKSSGIRKTSSSTVSYLKGVKKIGGSQVWDGNQEVYEIVGDSMFKHKFSEFEDFFSTNIWTLILTVSVHSDFILDFALIFIGSLASLWSVSTELINFSRTPNLLCSNFRRISFVQINQSQRNRL